MGITMAQIKALQAMGMTDAMLDIILSGAEDSSSTSTTVKASKPSAKPKAVEPKPIAVVLPKAVRKAEKAKQYVKLSAEATEWLRERYLETKRTGEYDKAMRLFGFSSPFTLGKMAKYGAGYPKDTQTVETMFAASGKASVITKRIVRRKKSA